MEGTTHFSGFLLTNSSNVGKNFEWNQSRPGVALSRGWMKTDVAIIGGGPGETATAMFLSQASLRTQAEAVAPLLRGDAVRGVRVRTSAVTVADIASEVLLNASGQANFLANAGVIGERFATTQKARSIYLRAGWTMKHLHPIWWRSG